MINDDHDDGNVVINDQQKITLLFSRLLGHELQC